MSERSQLTLSDGVRLYVEAWGPADALLTVVLSHGWCNDRRTWHHQISALREREPGVRIIAYDARGHGRSGSTRLPSATLGQLGDDLAEVLAGYAPHGPVVLAGHSMGGMMIMEYAAGHPDDFAARVAGLLLVSTSAEGTAHTEYGLHPRLATLMRAGEMLGAGVLARAGAWRPHRALIPALRPALRWLLFGDVCDDAAIRLTMKTVSRTSLRSIGGFRASIGAQQRLDTLTELGRVPAAVLVGDRDRLTPAACAEAIAAALPGTELTVCPGAGHMLLLERPDEVSAALVAVVEQARRATSAKRKRRAKRGRRAGYEKAA